MTKSFSQDLDFNRTSRRQFICGMAAGTLGCFGAGATTSNPTLGAARNDGDDEEPLWTFLAVADPHLREDKVSKHVQTPGAEGWAAVRKFRHLLGRINDLDHQPDFMLLLGDIHVDRYEEEVMDDIDMSVYPIVGNHEPIEERQRLRELYPRLFGDRDFYSFAHKKCLFIASCNAGHLDHVGHFESDDITPPVGQRKFIEEQLKRGRDHQHCIFFGHIPPHPEFLPNKMTLNRDDALWLREQVIEHRPSALFFGHRHRRIRFDIDGTPVYGIRSCNWNADREPIGFIEVKVLADRLACKFHPTLGQFDS